MKPGTRIEISGFNMRNERVWYPAKIGGYSKDCRKADCGPGWYPVTYDDGAKLLCHQENFRVVGNEEA